MHIVVGSSLRKHIYFSQLTISSSYNVTKPLACSGRKEKRKNTTNNHVLCKQWRYKINHEIYSMLMWKHKNQILEILSLRKGDFFYKKGYFNISVAP